VPPSRRQCTRSMAGNQGRCGGICCKFLVAGSGELLGPRRPTEQAVFHSFAPERPSPSALKLRTCSSSWRRSSTSRSRRFGSSCLTDFAWAVTGPPLVIALLSSKVLHPFRAAGLGGQSICSSSEGELFALRRGTGRVRPCEPPTGWLAARAFRAGAGFHQTFLFSRLAQVTTQ